MNMKADTNTEQLEMFRRELDDKIKGALVAIASDAIVDLRRRVEAGKGLKDEQMEPYTKAYAKFRESKGRKSKPRTLTFTGTMLGAIHVADVEKRGAKWVAVVGLADARSKKLALYNQKRTPWFGWSPSNKKEIKQSTKDHMTDVFGG